MQPSQTITTNLDGEPTNLTIERQLSSNAAPGQARGRTGLATGSGSITLTSNNNRPWSTRTPATGAITIDAKADIGQPSHRIFTGEITRINGTAANPTLQADIQDPRLNKTPLNIQSGFFSTLLFPDATHLIRNALETLGYHTAPPLKNNDTLYLPLHGTPADPRRQTVLSEMGDHIAWANIDGEAAARLKADDFLGYYWRWDRDETSHPWTFINFKLDVGTTLTITVFGTQLAMQRTGANAWAVTIAGTTSPMSAAKTVNGRGTLAIRLTGGLSDRKINIRWASNDDGIILNPIGIPTPATPAIDPLAMFASGGNAYIFWALMRNESKVIFTPTALLEATGYTVNSVFSDNYDDAWAYAQQVAEQTVSALIRKEDGTIALKSKEYLRGLDQPSKKTLGVDHLANLDWFKDYDETADRIEQYFTPVEESNATETVWEADSIIRVPANSYKDVNVVLEGVNSHRDLPFAQALTDPPEATMSRWIAFTTASGTSTMPGPDALKIVRNSTTPSEGSLRIHNTTNQTLWIRTENGNPALWLRSIATTRKGEQELIEIGASKEAARNTFTHDAGTSIQHYSDASNLAAWWWANLAGEPKTQISNISVLFDPSLKIADIITIYDPLFTNIRARALITRVSHDISADTHRTNIDVAILAVTALDVAKYFHAIDSDMTALERATWLQNKLGANVTAFQAAQWLEDNIVEI